MNTIQQKSNEIATKYILGQNECLTETQEIKDLSEEIQKLVFDSIHPFKEQLVLLAKMKADYLLSITHKDDAAQQCKDEKYNLDKTNMSLLHFWDMVEDFIVCY